MSYDVAFTEEAERQFFCWDVPRDVLSELERRLYDEVAVHPTRHLEPLKGVGKGMQWSPRIQGENPPITHLFVIRLCYVRETTLQILECFHFPLR